ncbi:MAG: PD-(D/E)XK nuclease family protein [Patescibacteria group bacterium]
MSQYYKPRRERNLFDPASHEPFRLSRSRLELFMSCPRCFYMDRRLGTDRPPGFPFSLNSAVDTLLKKEFDIHRASGTAHPLMKTYGIDAVPFQHEQMDEWRDSLRHGITYLHPETNFFFTGGVDDVWARPVKSGKVGAKQFHGVKSDQELIIVDYKATAKDGEVNLDAAWQIGYKRQMEMYQWLFRKNGFKVSDTGYFVYCNGRSDRKAFDGKLEFDITLLPYIGDDAWVSDTLIAARDCLMADKLPAPSTECDYCAYRAVARDLEK